MKTTFNIFIFALALVLMQACGSKSKESSEAVDATSATAAADEKAAQEKQAALEKRQAAQRERLRVAAERRAALEAYYKDDAGDLVYNKAEVAPSFPGGEKAMSKYFEDNLKYPKEAQLQGWDGTIYVEFVVARDGSVRGTTVTDETDQDVDQTLKDEAIRVVSGMPKWVPGRQLGKPVHVRFNLPVAFKMV